MGISTADLMDADPQGRQSCETQFRQFGGVMSFEGIVRTVECDDDTVLVKQVLAERGDGHVLVIDGHASMFSALMGDRTALMAAEHGWAGLVINGAVRDVDGLAGVPIGIKAVGTSPRKPRQEGHGRVDVPVGFGNVTFVPGRRLWSDADGVVVSRDDG